MREKLHKYDKYVKNFLYKAWKIYRHSIRFVIFLIGIVLSTYFLSIHIYTIPETLGLFPRTCMWIIIAFGISDFFHGIVNEWIKEENIYETGLFSFLKRAWENN